MAINYKKIWNGVTVVAKAASTSSVLGELETLTSDSKIYFHNGTSNSPIVTEAHAATLTNKSMDGLQNTFTNLPAGSISGQIPATQVGTGTVDNTEFGYLDGVTSSIQTQLNARPVSGAIVNADIAAGANIDAAKLGTGVVSNTEFNYLDGVTSAIQTQIDSKVTGPASATDNHIVRFDGTTGKLVQDGSPVTISDAGAISGLTGITSSGTAGLATVTASGSVGITGALDANGVISFASVNDAATGANATLTAPTTKVIRLTGASLSSIDGIPAGSDAQEIILENATGAVITLNNDTGATTANRIFTGTGANLTLANNASLTLSYDITSSRWRVIGGSGSGTSSGINYVTNGTAEAGTTGWALYNDGATAIPTDGTGGVATITLAASTSSPLRGTQSFLLTKGASNVQGQGVSYDFTIDRADLAQVLRISMNYEVSTNYTDTISGNLVSSDMQVFVYDVTNSQLIYCDTQNIGATTTEGLLVTTFQTNSNSSSYRLIFHIASTSALAYTLKFDNVVVGPQTLIKGPMDAYLGQLTTTGSWVTNTTYTFNYWRRGDRLIADGVVSTSGAPTATNLNIDLPAGLSIDSAKTNTTTNATYFGILSVNDSGATYYPGRVRGSGTGTNVRLMYIDASSQINNITQALPMTFGAGDNVYVRYEVPIAGWSSNQQLSEDGGNRLIAATLLRNINQSIPNGASTQVQFNVVANDTTSSFNTSTFTYVIPESGIYDITAWTGWPANSTGLRETQLLLNGSIQNYDTRVAATLGMGGAIALTARKLTKGDSITVQVYQNSGGALNLSAAELGIHKVSNPQTLAGSEIVAARAVSTGGQTFSNNTLTVITWDSSKTYDTHNALNTSTGVFTAPASGYYDVDSFIATASVAWTANTHQVDCYIYKNGSPFSRSIQFPWVSLTNQIYVWMNDSIYLSKGDTLDMRLSILRGASTSLYTGQANFVSIRKRN